MRFNKYKTSRDAKSAVRAALMFVRLAVNYNNYVIIAEFVNHNKQNNTAVIKPHSTLSVSVL